MANHAVLDVAVVGAGIAGLSAAVAIARAGHNVEVRWASFGALQGRAYVDLAIDIRAVTVFQ